MGERGKYWEGGEVVSSSDTSFSVLISDTDHTERPLPVSINNLLEQRVIIYTKPCFATFLSKLQFVEMFVFGFRF